MTMNTPEREHVENGIYCLSGNAKLRKDGHNMKHGHRSRKKPRSRTYNSWSSMIARCYDPNASNFQRYGGRGIKVCERWLVFENFLADMGERPAGMTLDRKNVNGDYEPSNCRWATDDQQIINRRSEAAVGKEENSDPHPFHVYIPRHPVDLWAKLKSLAASNERKVKQEALVALKSHLQSKGLLSEEEIEMIKRAKAAEI